MRAKRAKWLVVAGLSVLMVVGSGAIAIPDEVFESQGQQFRYFGSADDATDPENQGSNDVAKFATTSEAPVAGLYRDVRELVKELDNQLSLSYFFEGRSCGGGGPRVTLGIDKDNDGDVDGHINGHVGQPPTYAGCSQETWVHVDLTDTQRRWEIMGDLPGASPFPYATWDEIQAVMGEAHVPYGFLVEDANSGIAYFDLVTIGNEIFEDNNDSAGGINFKPPSP